MLVVFITITMTGPHAIAGCADFTLFSCYLYKFLCRIIYGSFDHHKMVFVKDTLPF